MQQIQQKAQKFAIKTPECANILIVEDQRFDRARLRRMCDKLDIRITTSEADTLASLERALQQDVFDLIFLDFHLPDGTGLEGLEMIQSDPRNHSAATIMVSGNEDADIAIETMKNGCSDFLKKADLSEQSVRRASINALQKASLNRSLETQEAMRTKVEQVLDRFAKECADEMKPMLTKMMRHVRALNSARTNDAQYYDAIKQISLSCERLFDFMSDIEDHERKAFVLSDTEAGTRLSDRTMKRPVATLKKGRLFGRQRYRSS